PRDDYPADLHIDYPKKLKQWFPLVKWFLAVPHYFVLIAFVGYSQESTNLPGLGPILILIALIVLLFTGRYLKDIFRLVMGINRWGYRVS
ncbi:hypothetical protein S1OALGB6SA_174, partial [Olavius algarvensis spirochete endosymbiont]|uniref:hypothetical protein n=1 Tax=Olavius algarvensis spirochete endosymbiont TaxID=260710 RepID=UPI000F165AA7